jgi:hypothetical protein
MSDFPAKPHIFVATPCFGGQVTSAFAMSLLGLQAACHNIPIDISFYLIGGDALITRARNLAVAKFLTVPDVTHFFFIDADIGFAPEQALALLAANKDVCGAIYPLKGLNMDRAREKILAGDPNPIASSLDYVVDLLHPSAPASDESFFRVRFIGTGFMMIKRHVFQRMAERYPELKYRHVNTVTRGDVASQQEAHAFFDCVIDPETGAYLSEDYTFCKRWTDMGGEIWANSDSKLTHYGSTAYAGDLRTFLQGLGQK